MASINLGRVQGYSAYEIAVQNGYSGTELEWLASLKGADGEDGTNGTDGVSPVASVERNLADTGAVITITDATGTTTATVYDGETPSLTGYATETYVDNAIADIDIPANTSDLNNDSGFITSADLSGYAQTSSLATVATSGSYNDLSNKPTIPDVSGLATETYVDNAVAGIVVPDSTSDLTNDSGFVTANDLAAVATSGDYDDLTNKPTIPTAPGIATTTDVGLVKPDGSTITIDANGVISSAGGGGSDIIPDGQTILMDENNEISTAIGGYRSPSGGEQVFELLESVTPSAWNSTYSRATLTSGQADSSVTRWDSGTYTIEYTYTYNGDTVSGSTTGTYVSGASYYLKADSSSTFIYEVGYLNGSYVIDIKAAFIGASVDSLNIYSPITYTYSPIDYHYIPIDNSTITISNGTLTSPIEGIDSKKVLNAGNNNSTSRYVTGSGIFGNNNSALGDSTYGLIIAGRNNTINNQAIASAILGEHNTFSGNSIGKVAIGTYNTVNGAGQVFGNSNTINGANIAVGNGLVDANNSAGRIILGKFNTSTGTAPFTIGMGTNANNRVDAMTIDASANTTFAGTVQATDFLDSNGDSIIGSGGDSLPTISSGDAGKALVVNSREDGVEWATVSGGSVPVDPEASSKNVYTGDGYWNNAWDTVQDASYGELLWEEPVEQDTTNHRFIFVTRDTFDFWGEDYSPLSVTMLGEDSNGNLIDGHDGFYWNGNDGYQNRDGFLSITRVIKSSGNNIYYLNLHETGEGTYEDIATINQFEISFDDFQRLVKENILPTTIDSSSRYIWTNQESDNMFSIGLNMYPTPENNFGADIDIPDLSVTPTSATVDGVTGALYEFTLTAGSEDEQFFDDWVSAERQKEIKLYDTQGNETGIMFEETETTSPLTSLGDALVERNRNGFSIFMPGYDVRELLPIQEIKIGQYYTSEFGLVDYDYIQNEVISRPPEFPIRHTDTTDPNTYHNTEWQSNRLYFIDTARDEVLGGGYEDVDVITSSIGTDGMSIEYDSKRDSIKDKATYTQSGISFNHIEYTDDGRGNVTYDVNETFIWTPEGIQLKDQTTGDIYQLSIDNGQIVLTNVSM